VEVSVCDTGIGIAEKDLPRLFDAFERLDTHLRVKAGGTGLGLYLTKKLASDILHGGVSVQSRPGQGSTFTLKIPMDLRQAHASAHTTAKGWDNR
jgi:signal transduction histidine kinase